MTRRIPRLLLPLLLLAAAACSDDRGGGTGTAPPPTPAPVTTEAGSAPLPGSGTVVEVDSLDNVFQADSITIRAGTTVRFVNRGRNDHNVLPETGTAWGVQTADFLPGDEYSVAFDEPGTYPYYCSIHGLIKDGRLIGMAGTIEVTG